MEEETKRLSDQHIQDVDWVVGIRKIDGIVWGPRQHEDAIIALLGDIRRHLIELNKKFDGAIVVTKGE